MEINRDKIKKIAILSISSALLITILAITIVAAHKVFEEKNQYNPELKENLLNFAKNSAHLQENDEINSLVSFEYKEGSGMLEFSARSESYLYHMVVDLKSEYSNNELVNYFIDKTYEETPPEMLMCSYREIIVSELIRNESNIVATKPTSGEETFVSGIIKDNDYFYSFTEASVMNQDDIESLKEVKYKISKNDTSMIPELLEDIMNG